LRLVCLLDFEGSWGLLKHRFLFDICQTAQIWDWVLIVLIKQRYFCFYSVEKLSGEFCGTLILWKVYFCEL